MTCSTQTRITARPPCASNRTLWQWLAIRLVPPAVSPRASSLGGTTCSEPHTLLGSRHRPLIRKFASASVNLTGRSLIRKEPFASRGTLCAAQVGRVRRLKRRKLCTQQESLGAAHPTRHRSRSAFPAPVPRRELLVVPSWPRELQIAYGHSHFSSSHYVRLGHGTQAVGSCIA